MDADKIATGIGDLIKDPLLLLGVIGLGFFLVAGLGSWPGSQSAPIELPWRLGLGIVALAVAGFSLIHVFKKAIRTSGLVKQGWGTHRAEVRIIDELPIIVIELSDKFDKIGDSYRWEKAEKAG